MTAACWNCGKAVRVAKDNDNIYTRICGKCMKEVTR